MELTEASLGRCFVRIWLYAKYWSYDERSIFGLSDGLGSLPWKTSCQALAADVRSRLALYMVVMLIVLAVSGQRIMRWNDGAYGEIRSAAAAYSPPETWTLISTEFVGSKWLYYYSSERRYALLEYHTDESGPEVCQKASASLVELSGSNVVELEVGPGNLCGYRVDGDFAGITSAVVRVDRVSLGGGEYSGEVDRVVVGLSQPVSRAWQ